MGSKPFTEVGWGGTPAEAFADARRAAGLEHGYGEDTGSLVDKDSFRLISRTFRDAEEAWDYVHTLLHGPYHPAQDSASPAYAVRLPLPSEDRAVEVSTAPPDGSSVSRSQRTLLSAYVFFGYAAC